MNIRPKKQACIEPKGHGCSAGLISSIPSDAGLGAGSRRGGGGVPARPDPREDRRARWEKLEPTNGVTSPFGGVTGLGVVRRKTDTPHEVERALFQPGA